MELYSTNKQSPNVNLREALFHGLPSDNGLYLPVKIPLLPENFFDMPASLQEIGYVVSAALFADEVPDRDIKNIVEDAINFDAPLEALSGRSYVMELFHGPTLAFKDFGARFMARLMAYFMQDRKEPLTILVATSGDTGSAVAHGFYEVEGIRVIILYPKGKISPFQEKQMTTLGKNITALEVEGTFDDCQALVKKAFLDKEINAAMAVTSANSINIGRLIPQSFYYFYAQSLLDSAKPIIFSVPSGNFGNLCGGILAYKMGLPVKRFVAATNINDIVPAYLSTGKFTPKASLKTISNAMDVGNPSNFVRLKALFAKDGKEMSKMMYGAAFTDKETRETIQNVSATLEYTLDPHTAVGYLGLQKYRENAAEASQHPGVILATAHPSKFIDVVEEATGSKVIVPDRLRSLLSKPKTSIFLKNDFEALKELLFSL